MIPIKLILGYVVKTIIKAYRLKYIVYDIEKEEIIKWTKKYRTYLERLIEDYSAYKPSYGDIEVQVLFDRKHDHYQLNSIGWHGNERIHSCLLHLDIKNEKIWIQYNGTEVSLAKELVTLGVPKEDIVLAFQPSYKRPHTGYAVG
jgi:hypothetical protein